MHFLKNVIVSDKGYKNNVILYFFWVVVNERKTAEKKQQSWCLSNSARIKKTTLTIKMSLEEGHMLRLVFFPFPSEFDLFR